MPARAKFRKLWPLSKVRFVSSKLYDTFLGSPPHVNAPVPWKAKIWEETIRVDLTYVESVIWTLHT